MARLPGALVVALLAAACSADVPEAARSAVSAAAPATTTATASTTTSAPTTTTGQPATTAPPPPPAPAVAGPSPAPVTANCGLPPGYPEPWADRPRYTARLAVDPPARRVTGELSVRFTPDASTDRIVFRLWPNAPRPGRAGSRLEITSASVGSRPVNGTYEPAGAAAGRPGTLFALPGPLAAGEAVEARLEFRLSMPGAINDRVAQIGQSLRLGSVLPVLSWVRGEGWQTSPAVDAFAEAAVSEAADYDVTVTVPPGFGVLATGVEPEPGRFTATAVRDWAATVARMRMGQAPAQGGRTTVVVGVAEGSRDDPAAIAARAARALDGLAARFGEYPYPRLTLGVTTALTGGVEFPTHIHLGSGVAGIHLVHEVAHQWFYGVAGNDQYRHPWLDEALATYAESRVGGRLAGQRARATPAAGRGRLGESMAYWDRQGGRTYYLSVYIGGLQALGALADHLGGYEALDCGLRRYHRDRAYAVSRPADLFAAIQAQSGIDPRPVLARFGIS